METTNIFLIIAGGIVLLIIQVMFTRWLFRVDERIELLKEINISLKKMNGEKIEDEDRDTSEDWYKKPKESKS